MPITTTISSLGRRRSRAVVGASVLLALTLVGAACSTDVDTGPPTATGPGDCDPAIHDALAGWEEVGFSGTVAFLDSSRPCQAAFGTADPFGDDPMTVDTVFSIGSITKAVTAAAIADLVHDGRLAYDDRAGDLVAGLTGPVADATVAQLLLHTGGFAGNHGRDHEALTSDAAIVALSGLEAVAEPGTTFGYANAGYATLALIVDAVGGGYRDHLSTEILIADDGMSIGGFWDGEPSPRGPRAVGVVDGGTPGVDGSFGGPHWALDGAGGVAMTAGELARWTADLFGGRIVEPAAIDDLLGLRFDHGDGTVEVPGWVEIDEVPFGEPVLGAAGGGGGIGHQMAVAWLPRSGRAFVIATNTPDVGAEDLLASLLPDLVEGLAPVGPPVASELAPDLVAAVSGRWELPDGSRFDIGAEGPGLRVRALDPGAVPVVLPVGDPEAAADHERRVLAVIGGSTAEGRRERELFEESVGPIDEVVPFGTAFIQGEYRTWIEIRFVEGDQLLAWMALEPNDAIAAVEVGTEPPTATFLARDDGSIGPLDDAGGGDGPRLAWDGVELRITNGERDALAVPAG